MRKRKNVKAVMCGWGEDGEIRVQAGREWRNFLAFGKMGSGVDGEYKVDLRSSLIPLSIDGALLNGYHPSQHYSVSIILV